jgi:hypothetical protein
MKKYLNLNSVEQAEFASRRSTECRIPLVEGLQTIHHRAIVAVRGGSDEEENNPAVESDETLVVRPFPIRVKEVVEAAIGTPSRNSTGTHARRGGQREDWMWLRRDEEDEKVMEGLRPRNGAETLRTELTLVL